MVRLNLYSGNDQKESADATLANMMDGMGYSQDYVLEVIRLGAGYLGILLCGLVFFVQKKKSWEEAQGIIALCCISYFALQSYVWLSRRFLEHQAVCIAKKKGTPGPKLYISTTNPRNSGLYCINVWYNGADHKKEVKFSDFVDYNGNVVRPELLKILQDLLPKSS